MRVCELVQGKFASPGTPLVSRSDSLFCVSQRGHDIIARYGRCNGGWVFLLGVNPPRDVKTSIATLTRSHLKELFDQSI